MAWCLVKHRDNFTFYPFLPHVIGFENYDDLVATIGMRFVINYVKTND
jgi:hypothetical protein